MTGEAGGGRRRERRRRVVRSSERRMEKITVRGKEEWIRIGREEPRTWTSNEPVRRSVLLSTLEELGRTDRLASLRSTGTGRDGR